MRYLLRRIRDNGTPVAGTIDTTSSEYANDHNAIRYMARTLRKPHFTPGQYLLTTWPRHGTNEPPPEREIATLYKRA